MNILCLSSRFDWLVQKTDSYIVTWTFLHACMHASSCTSVCTAQVAMHIVIYHGCRVVMLILDGESRKSLFFIQEINRITF